MNDTDDLNFDFEIEKSLKVLNDSTRMALLFVILREKEVSVDDLRKSLNIKGNTIYYHLKLLERTNLLSLRKEPVKDTNLTRKLYSINSKFWQMKNDPKWAEIVQKNMKAAFMIEMYLAIASLMEAIQRFRTMSEEEFHQFHSRNNPQVDVLFMKKDDYTTLQEIINKFIEERYSEEFSEILNKSEGYVYSIFAYPSMK